VYAVAQTSVQSVRPAVASDGLGTLEAMANLALQTASVVHVVLARRPGVADRARTVAQVAGIRVTVDVTANTVRARFDGRPSL
jgi:hypothetical protein